MRKTLLSSSVVAVVAVGFGLATALPASAADTITTFTLTGGALSVTAPATSDIGPGVAGGDPFGDQLGAVTVTDDRGALLATWESLVFSTDFTTGGGTPEETIVAASNVEYWSGELLATEGAGTVIPRQPSADDAEFLDGIIEAVVKTTGAGNNSATWNPSLIVTPPAGSVTGVYTATVVHTFV